MTRAEHFRRAEGILAPVDERQKRGNGVGPAGDSTVALAQVHAMLAAVPAEVAGEAPPEAPDPDVVVSRLLEALQELSRGHGMVDRQVAAHTIRQRVFGTGAGR